MSDRPTERVLLDNATDKVAVVSESGEFRYASAATRRLLGFDPDELIGRSVFDFVHPADVARVRESFLAAVRGVEESRLTETYRHRTADGSWLWIESRMSNVQSDRLDGFVVSSRDVSDRVRAERTADRLRALASVSADVLWQFSADWSELYYVNDAVEDLYDVSPAALSADPTVFLETIHDDDIERVLDAMETLSGGESADIEYRIDPHGEGDHWVWVKAVPVIEDGTVSAVAGFSRDVTDRHRRERHLVVMDNLLRHNLRNSLNVVLGTTERLERDDLDTGDATARIRAAVEDLLDSADKQRRIIKVLQSKTQRPRRTLRTQLARAVGTVEERHPAVTVETDIRLSGADVEVPTLIGTAVTELTENAVLHDTGDDPTVALRARVVDGVAHVDVVDDCPSLPPVEADVLRGEFHTHDRVYHSGGLGTRLVYWCVELSGGDVVIERADGGNRIGLRVPLGGRESPEYDAGATAVRGRGRSP